VITKDWLREQIIILSNEREAARMSVSKAKAAFTAAKDMLDMALSRLDSIDGCISGLQDELSLMNKKETGGQTNEG
jgi:predicted  nucleic acid-binding Zn-ribbon protein